MIGSPGWAGSSSALRASVLETGGINLRRRAQAPFPWDFKGSAHSYFSQGCDLSRTFSSICLERPIEDLFPLKILREGAGGCLFSIQSGRKTVRHSIGEVR
jgi:hypothetical protein